MEVFSWAQKINDAIDALNAKMEENKASDFCGIDLSKVDTEEQEIIELIRNIMMEEKNDNTIQYN